MNRGPVIMFGVESKNRKVLNGLVSRVPSCSFGNHSDWKFRTIWLRCLTKKHQLRPAGGQTPDSG
jgi:hypothetical protein